MVHRTELKTHYTLRRGNDWLSVEDYGDRIIIADKHGAFAHSAATAQRILKTLVQRGYARQR